jgi:hypothetical protein
MSVKVIFMFELGCCLFFGVKNEEILNFWPKNWERCEFLIEKVRKMRIFSVKMKENHLECWIYLHLPGWDLGVNNQIFTVDIYVVWGGQVQFVLHFFALKRTDISRTWLLRKFLVDVVFQEYTER